MSVLLLCLLSQFEITRGFTVESAPPLFHVEPAPPKGSVPSFTVRTGVLPEFPPPSAPSGLERAAREGRVYLVWVGTKNEALARLLPQSWIQEGPVASYGGHRGPGVAVGVPFRGSLYYRTVIPAQWDDIHDEVRRLSPAPPPVSIPPQMSVPRAPRPFFRSSGNC